MKELNIKLTINELNLILESLGNLPYIRVYELINQIQNQAKEQLNGSSTGIDLNQQKDAGLAAGAKAEVHSN